MQTEKSYINLDHSNQVLTQVSELWKSKLLCDATIEVGPVKVYTHRLVLVASCPWLATLLRGKDDQAVSNLEIKLPRHVGIDALNSLLFYLYNGELNLNLTNLRQIENLANILKVPKVIEYCQEFRSFFGDTDEISPTDVIPTTYNIDTRKSTLVITCKENTLEDYIGRSLNNTPKKTKSDNNTPQKARALNHESEQVRNSQQERSMRNTHQQARILSNTPQQARVLSNSPQQARSLGNSPQQARILSNSPQQARRLSKSPQQASILSKSPHQARVLSNSPQQARILSKSPQQARRLSKSPQQSWGSLVATNVNNIAQQKRSAQGSNMLSNTAQQTRNSQGAKSLNCTPQQKRSPQVANRLSNTPQQTINPERAKSLNNTPQQKRSPQAARGLNNASQKTKSPQGANRLSDTAQHQQTRGPREARTLNNTPQQTRIPQALNVLSSNTAQQARKRKYDEVESSIPNLSNSEKNVIHHENQNKSHDNSHYASGLQQKLRGTKEIKEEQEEFDDFQVNRTPHKSQKSNGTCVKVTSALVTDSCNSQHNSDNHGTRTVNMNIDSIKQEPRVDTEIYSICTNSYNKNSTWSSCLITSSSLLSSQSLSIDQPGSYPHEISNSRQGHTAVYVTSSLTQNGTETTLTPSSSHAPTNLSNISRHGYHLQSNQTPVLTSIGQTNHSMLPRQPTVLVSNFNPATTWTSNAALQANPVSSFESSRKRLRFLLPAQGNGTTSTLQMQHTTSTVTYPQSSNMSVTQSKKNPVLMTESTLTYAQNAKLSTTIPVAMTASTLTYTQNAKLSTNVPVAMTTSTLTYTQNAKLSTTVLVAMTTSTLTYTQNAKQSTTVPVAMTTSTLTYTQNPKLSTTVPVAMTASTLSCTQNAKLSTTALVFSTANMLTHLQKTNTSKPQLTTIHIVRTNSSVVEPQKTSHFTSSPAVGTAVGSTGNGRQYLVLPTMRPASENNPSCFYTYRPNNPGLLLSPDNRMFLPVVSQFIVCPTASPSGSTNTQIPATFSFANSPTVLSTSYSSPGPSAMFLQPVSFVVPKNNSSLEILKSGTKTKEINGTFSRSQDPLIVKTVPSTTTPLVSLLNTRQSNLTSARCHYATRIPNSTSVVVPSIVSNEEHVGEITVNLHSAVEKSVSEILPLLSMPVVVSESGTTLVPRKVYNSVSKVTPGDDKVNKDRSKVTETPRSKVTETSELKDGNANSTCNIKMLVRKEPETSFKQSSKVKKSDLLVVSNDSASSSTEKEHKGKKVQTGLSQGNQSNDNTCHMTKKTIDDLTRNTQSSCTQRASMKSSSEHEHNKTTTKPLKRKHNCLSSADTAMECSNPKLPKIITKSIGDGQHLSKSSKKTKLSESVKEKLASGLQKFGKHFQDVKKASKADRDNSLCKENKSHVRTDQLKLTPVSEKSDTPGQLQSMSATNKIMSMVLKTKGAVVLRKKSNQELVCSVTPVNGQNNDTSQSKSVNKEEQVPTSRNSVTMTTNKQIRANKTCSIRSNQEKPSAVKRGKLENKKQVTDTQQRLRSNQSIQSNESSGNRSYKNKVTSTEGNQKSDTGKQVTNKQLMTNKSKQSQESSGQTTETRTEINKEVIGSQPSSNKSKQNYGSSGHTNKVNDAASLNKGKQTTETRTEFRKQVNHTPQRSLSNQTKQNKVTDEVPPCEEQQKIETGTQTFNTRIHSISHLPVPSSELCKNKSSGYEQIYLHSAEKKSLKSNSLTDVCGDKGITKSTAEKNVDRQGMVTSTQRCGNSKDVLNIAKESNDSKEKNLNHREGSKNVSETAKSGLSQTEKHEDKKGSNTENYSTSNKNKCSKITMNDKDIRYNRAMVKQQHEKVSWTDRFRDNRKTTNSSITKISSNINTVESYYTANYSNKEKTKKGHTEGHDHGKGHTDGHHHEKGHTEGHYHGKGHTGGHGNHNVKQSNTVVTTTVAMVSNSSSGHINTGAGDSHVIPSTTPLGLLANMVKEKIRDLEKFPFPTSWGVGVFREWLIHKGLSPLFEDMENSALDDVLMEFYPDIKNQESSTLFTGALHIIRNAIIKHLESSNQLSTKNCKELIYSNAVFEELTNEKCPITAQGSIRTDDFKKLYRSQVFSDLDPVSLQRKVWFEITLYLNEHWKSLIDSMLSLKKDSFILCTDANGKHYYEMRPDASWNNGAREGKVGHHQSRVKCPVHVLEFYLSKLHPNCNAFFQKPNLSVKRHKFWYSPNPLCKFRLQNMMSQISIDAKLSRIYTNTAVKTTSALLLQNCFCSPTHNAPTKNTPT